MSKTLRVIAEQLNAPRKVKNKKTTEVEVVTQMPKVQLIYAFNGTGKTRLSRIFKELIAPDNTDNEDGDKLELSRKKILYYNAFTEDLFYWDNDLEPKLKIQPNTFTDWILGERGLDGDIVDNFQRYTDDKLMPLFHEKDLVQAGKKTGKKTYPEVTFSLATGSESTPNLKISKGEERNFVWSVFYTLLQEVASVMEEADPANPDDNPFNELEYVFIDDPVSSLDDNHLIELAVDLADLVKRSHYRQRKGLRFVITTHSPLFYNVLWNEFNNDLENPKPNSGPRWLYKRNQSARYLLKKKSYDDFELLPSNDHPFSYHLSLLAEMQKAVDEEQIKKYHFAFLRNILEKTATFLGHKHWESLLEKMPEETSRALASRLMNLASHSAHSDDEIADVDEKLKEQMKKIVTYLTETYDFRL